MEVLHNMGKKTGPHLLQKEFQLAAAEVKAKPPAKKTATKPASKKRTNAAPAKKKRPPLPGGASFPSFQLPNPKSPTFYDDSIRTMSSLRRLCKQCMGYMQKADQWIDHLHGFGSHLHQAGVLPKISQGNFKDMTTSEWGTLLMALMNSPFSSMLLGAGGQAKPAEEPKQEN